MGGKIPKTIKKRVIMQWLYGISRDQIAKANQIGAGTVSAIIKQCKLEEQQKKEYAADDDFEFDLIRVSCDAKKRRCGCKYICIFNKASEKIRAEGVE